MCFTQLRGCDFDALIHSPLARAAETARIVWGDRDGPITELPTLREVDLYAFQVCAHALSFDRLPKLIVYQHTRSIYMATSASMLLHHATAGVRRLLW